LEIKKIKKKLFSHPTPPPFWGGGALWSDYSQTYEGKYKSKGSLRIK
jgi:hypothetical protein